MRNMYFLKARQKKTGEFNKTRNKGGAKNFNFIYQLEAELDEDKENNIEVEDDVNF